MTNRRGLVKDGQDAGMVPAPSPARPHRPLQRPGPRRRPRFVRFAVIVTLGVLTAVGPAMVGRAAASGTPAASGPDLRVVVVNLLHGTFCDDGAQCAATDRVALFVRQLADAACPEVVGIQEVSDVLRPLLATAAPTVCGGRYRTVFGDSQGNDEELVLTTLPVRSARLLDLPGPLRHAARVVLADGRRDVVVVVTHQDGDATFPVCRDEPARYRCPAPCPEGTDFPTCQTVLADRLTRPGPRVRPGAVRVLMGDFNLVPGSPRHTGLLARGWLDTHRAAGNPECDPTTGTGCTGGRADTSLAALRDPTAREAERIDYIFVKPPEGCRAVFDGPTDPDHDGLGTGLFAAAPAVGGPGGLVWPSDHTAVSMDMSCA